MYFDLRLSRFGFPAQGYVNVTASTLSGATIQNTNRVDRLKRKPIDFTLAENRRDRV